MVNVFAMPAWAAPALLAAEDAELPLKQLDPQSRAGVLLALAGLVILGLGMIALVWLGAQHVRRLARQRPIERPRDESSWTAAPRIRDDALNDRNDDDD
jgi:hypothetical protein